MIIKCKVCQGSWRVLASAFSIFDNGEVCPVCKSAGEFEVIIPLDKQIACKFCKGKRIVQDSLQQVFRSTYSYPACKGIGVIERPVVGTGQSEMNSTSIPQTPWLSHYYFDIAVSFASEVNLSIIIKQ